MLAPIKSIKAYEKNNIYGFKNVYLDSTEKLDRYCQTSPDYWLNDTDIVVVTTSF